MQDRSRLVLGLTQELARIAPHEEFPLRLCRAFSRFAAADGGAISLGFTTAERTLLCFTDEVVSLVEDVQDTLVEGPTLDAFRTRRPVVPVSADDQARRWPALIDSMPTSVSPRLLYAFPMLPDGTLVGVVSLHVQLTRPLTRDPAELDFLAGVLGAAIVGGAPSEGRPAALWSERDKVAQATGMVVAQLGLSPADALAVLRAHAFAHEASVAEISRLVLARELVFTADDERGHDGQES
jgi:hypothetical protein